MKRCIALFIVSCMYFLFPSASEAAFKDVPTNHQFYEEITYLNEEGIINGYEDNTFRPNQLLTRGQAAKILARTLHINTTNVVDAKFKDISKSHQYYKEISALKQLGILNGYENNTFRPNENLQTYHIAKMLTNAFTLTSYREKPAFNDMPKEYVYYVRALYENNITLAETTAAFNGRAAITRGQMAAFLYRASLASNIGTLTYREDQSTNLFPLYDVNWKMPLHDYIFSSNDETFSVLEARKSIKVTTYNKQYEQISVKTIPLELPIFGAFYHGEKYNYIAYGQNNPDEKNIEVIRIVKYDHQFNKIDSVSIAGHDITTTVPFKGSSGGQMAEYGDKLVYHTSRERYKAADGYNHQSQLTIEMNTNTMTVTNKLEEFQWNHVSHSFDQYVLMDKGEAVFVDHGDAYPRSLVLQKETEEDEEPLKSEFHKILGDIGMNFTGVTIGGVTQSSTHYLIAYSGMQYIEYVYPSSDFPNRDVNVVAVNKETLKADFSFVNYSEYKNIFVTPPTITEVKEDVFLVLWQEYLRTDTFGPAYGIYVDGKGDFISEVEEYQNAFLSRTTPILFNGRIIWPLNTTTVSAIFNIRVE